MKTYYAIFNKRSGKIFNGCNAEGLQIVELFKKKADAEMILFNDIGEERYEIRKIEFQY